MRTVHGGPQKKPTDGADASRYLLSGGTVIREICLNLHGNVVEHCVTLADAYSWDLIHARRVLRRYVLHIWLCAGMEKCKDFGRYVCHASMMKMDLMVSMRPTPNYFFIKLIPFQDRQLYRVMSL